MYISNLDQSFPAEYVAFKTFLKENKFYKTEEIASKKPNQNKRSILIRVDS